MLGRRRTTGWLFASALALLSLALVLACSSRASDGGPLPTASRLAPSPSFEVEPQVRLGPAPPRRDAAAGVPVRLVVPSLDVAAPVVPVRTATDGKLWAPRDPTEAGWWTGGAVPGARYGSALIVGHTVHTGGGVFDDLARLARGDRLRLRTRHGVIGYRVTSVSLHRKAAFARDVPRVLDPGVPGRLVLVTCDDWNGQVYLSNAVVTAKPLAPAGS